jgi:uncharacterized protein YndB with AHSA1/START domain
MVAQPDQQSIVATTFINAPRELVFKVMHDPETIPQWWGPRVLTTTVDKMEPQAGGSWRYVLRAPGGSKQWAFHGVYHSIEAPERSIFTYEDEDLPGQVSLETTLYEEYDGGTKVTTISVHQSVEIRDAMLQSDMEDGAAETMVRLEELLESMRVPS